MKMHMPKAKVLLLFLIATTNYCYCKNVEAAITGIAGDVSLIGPPASVARDALVSDTTIFGFFEKQNVTLASDLLINGSGAGIHGSGVGGGGTTNYSIAGMDFIAAGMPVDSYFFHADPDDPALKEYEGSITFDSVILGVVFLDDRLHLSDLILGLDDTTYVDHDFRDFEIGGGCGVGVSDCVEISSDLKTITLNLRATTYYDQIRVITAVVPEPGSLVLLSLGLMGMIWMRRAE